MIEYIKTMTDLEEAYAILAGTTMMLPEARHIQAVVDAHERALATMARELMELREGIGK